MVKTQDDGQVVILHIMLNMNPANKNKAFQKIVSLHDCQVSDK